MCQWLPDPQPNQADQNHYLPFSALFGVDTEEKFRPSSAAKAANEDPDRTSFDFTAARARDIVLCGECLKPRIVYS